MGSESAENVVERPNDWVLKSPVDDCMVLEPFALFSGPVDMDSSSLIILNTPLDDIDIRHLWEKTSLHVCADGAANRLYEYFSDKERSDYIPQFITGDCDSLTTQVREYYEHHGTRVIPQYSQYSTDFMKSVKLVSIYHTNGRKQLREEVEEVDGLTQLMKEFPDPRPTNIYVAGGIDGRFDQTFQLINQLYTMKVDFPKLKVFFITAQDCIFLVPEGRNLIKYPSRLAFNSQESMPSCGLLPFGGRVTLNTEGLQYDVTNWTSFVGGPVSSNNRVVGINGFIVQTSGDIIMNVEVTHKRRKLL